MRYINVLLIILLIFLAGCYAEPAPPSESPAVFSITDEDRTKYGGIVKDILDGFYWKYDFNSLYYEDENLNLGDRSDRTYLESERAAASIGLDISKGSGGNATVASLNIFHNDNEPAGAARFFFIRGKLFLAYYSPPGDDNARLGLGEKNIYLIKDPFAAYEDVSIPYPEPAALGEKDFASGGAPSVNNKTYGNTLATVAEDKIFFYEYSDSDGRFSLKKELSFGDRVPLDFALLAGGGCAALLGDRDGGWDGAKEYVSKCLNVYDEKLNLSFTEELGEGYTAAASYGGSLVLCRGSTVEFYTLRQSGLVKRSQAILQHWAASIEFADLAGGGVTDMIVTDGSDLYLYRLKAGDIPELVWRTRYGLAVSESRVSVCDLNGDGVNEIYLTDDSLTCIRYTLGLYGLRAEAAGEAGVHIFFPNENGWMIYD